MEKGRRTSKVSRDDPLDASANQERMNEEEIEGGSNSGLEISKEYASRDNISSVPLSSSVDDGIELSRAARERDREGQILNDDEERKEAEEKAQLKVPVQSPRTSDRRPSITDPPRLDEDEESKSEREVQAE